MLMPSDNFGITDIEFNFYTNRCLTKSASNTNIEVLQKHNI